MKKTDPLLFSLLPRITISHDVNLKRCRGWRVCVCEGVGAMTGGPRGSPPPPPFLLVLPTPPHQPPDLLGSSDFPLPGSRRPQDQVASAPSPRVPSVQGSSHVTAVSTSGLEPARGPDSAPTRGAREQHTRPRLLCPRPRGPAAFPAGCDSRRPWVRGHRSPSLRSCTPRGELLGAARPSALSLPRGEVRRRAPVCLSSPVTQCRFNTKVTLSQTVTF